MVTKAASKVVVVETVPCQADMVGHGAAWECPVASVALAGDMVVVMVEDMAGRAAEAYCRLEQGTAIRIGFATS